ncbi:MAG: 2-oxoacid:acceptor oxidoreductase family protein [Candidatus Bipolaricaulaceae bacterium]
MAELRLRLSGIGGQGVVFAGRLLAQALFEEGKEIALRYAYGAEVMGTPVHSELVISDEPIICPYFHKADVAVVLHPRALDQALSALSPGGLLVGDSTVAVPRMLSRVEVRPFVARTSKGRPGDPGRLAPVAALGFLAKLGFFPLEPLLRAAQRGPAAQENLEALRLGFDL